MDVTVAIAAKNSADIIGGCLSSLAAQTEAPAEVLVIVDDEDDPTIAAALEHRARVVLNHGRKLYQARNTALQACKTEVLAFVDADCELSPQWVREAKRVLRAHPEVAGGTGPHPMLGRHNLSSWLHHMWFVVETLQPGYVNGVIGGNSFFRREALEAVGGWADLQLLAAEDVLISRRLLAAGYRLWFTSGCVASHHYKAELWGFFRQAVVMGHDIVLMMRRTGEQDWLWYYTLSIPVGGALFLAGLASLYWFPIVGGALSVSVLVGSFLALSWSFRSIRKALPRWLARWVIIWPYSYGILKGLLER